MSMVLTRSPLEPIGMNGAGTQKRRSARLSHEGAGEDEPPAKRSKANGVQTTTVSTKERDGDANAIGKRKPRKAYDEEVDGFSFTKVSRKAKASKQPAVRNSTTDQEAPPPPPAPVSAATTAPEPVPAPAPKEDAAPKTVQKKARAEPEPAPAPAPKEDAAPKTVQKKTRRRFPTTPERKPAEKPVRRSKRLSDEHVSSDPQPSPHKAAHAKSHANVERSPSPEKAKPITIEKKRKRGANGGEEEEKIMRIALPFADTPVIRRNKEMRKSSADGSRRSSSGMRGRRASSLIDEGRGNGMYTLLFVATSLSPNPTPLLAEASDLSPAASVRSNSYKHLGRSNFGSPTPPTSDSTSPVIFPTVLSHKFAQDVFADEAISGTAMPHAEVPATEFFKHISADLTEPRRMRCLMGWCGSRALPPKPDAPKESTPASSLEFQALQAGKRCLEWYMTDLC